MRRRYFQPCRVIPIIALWLLCGLPALAQQTRQQPERQLDLRYIPRDAVGAVVAFPQELTKQPNFEVMPVEIIQAIGQQELGFNPLDVTQAVALLGAPQPPMPPVGGFILKLSKPLQLSEKLLATTEPARIGSVEYHRGFPFSYCVVDKNTLLIAQESYLEKMIGARAGNADSALIKLLKGMNFQAEATAVLAVDPLRGVVKQVLGQAPPLPPPLQGATRLPDQLQAIVLEARFITAGETTLTLRAVDAAAAAQVADTLTKGMAFGKQVFLANATQELAGNDDIVQQASVKYVVRMADLVERQLKPQTKGNNVVISVKSDVATTGVLVSLLLPAVQAARDAARRMEAGNNMRMIGIALLNYHDVYGSFPTRAVTDDQGNPLLSWRVQLLPYLEEQELYDQFHLDEPWDSEHNRKLIAQMPDVYRNPNFLGDEGTTNYLALESEEGVLASKPTSVRDILDGLSNTITVVEADREQSIPWTKPSDLPFDVKDPMRGLGQLRPGGFQAIFADASVHFISNTIDLDTLRAMVTRAGSEVVELP